MAQVSFLLKYPPPPLTHSESNNFHNFSLKKFSFSCSLSFHTFQTFLLFFSQPTDRLPPPPLNLYCLVLFPPPNLVFSFPPLSYSVQFSARQAFPYVQFSPLLLSRSVQSFYIYISTFVAIRVRFKIHTSIPNRYHSLFLVQGPVPCHGILN